MTPIYFYFACASLWSYLALGARHNIGKQFDREIAYKPIDVERAWRETNTGRPLGEKPLVLQQYRHCDLPRWAAYRRVEIDPTPKKLSAATKFFSSKMIIAARQQGYDVYPLVRAFMQACWIDNKDISDTITLEAIANDAGFDGSALRADAEKSNVADEMTGNTNEALQYGAWSVPSFVIDDELFYGQDRLDMMIWRLDGGDN